MRPGSPRSIRFCTRAHLAPSVPAAQCDDINTGILALGILDEIVCRLIERCALAGGDKVVFLGRQLDPASRAHRVAVQIRLLDVAALRAEFPCQLADVEDGVKGQAR